MKTLSYIPSGGVCARQMDITVGDDDRIISVKITGGCAGNSQGVSRLVEGLPLIDAIDRLAGIDCKGRGTSCPDQLARALAGML